jgi:hypothetical protein
MKKVEIAQAASARCAGLGQAMGAAAGGGGLSGDGLSGLVDELDSLDALQQQALVLEASLAELSGLLEGLGEGIGQGSRWEIGEGGGYGGKGIGLSTVPEHIITSDPLKANKMAKAPTRGQGGPVVASWYFRDEQIKGEAQRESDSAPLRGCGQDILQPA